MAAPKKVALSHRSAQKSASLAAAHDVLRAALEPSACEGKPPTAGRRTQNDSFCEVRGRLEVSATVRSRRRSVKRKKKVANRLLCSQVFFLHIRTVGQRVRVTGTRTSTIIVKRRPTSTSPQATIRGKTWSETFFLLECVFDTFQKVPDIVRVS
jgi:hypothetical protein